MSEPTPQQIVDAFRAAGLTVHEMPGWRGRCRCHNGSHEKRESPSRDWQTPKGITWHHTAGPTLTGQKAIDYTQNILIGGNGQTPGPLCLAGVDGDGRIIMVGAGRANHLGSISQSAAAAIRNGSWSTAGSQNLRGRGVDGNSFTYGFEALAYGAPNAAQRDAMVRASAVLCKLLEIKPAAVHGHGEASDQRDFSDPGLDMGRARRDVAATLARTAPTSTVTNATTTPSGTTTTQEEDDMAHIESISPKAAEVLGDAIARHIISKAKGDRLIVHSALESVSDAAAKKIGRNAKPDTAPAPKGDAR